MSFLLQTYLDRQAERQPEATAVVSESARISYGELFRRSNQLACALKAAGCRQGDRISILLPKSIDALTGMLASLKAGCIYVPMDTSSPFTRLQMVLQLAQSSFVLASPASEGLLRKLVPDLNHSAIRVGYMADQRPSDFPVAFCGSDLDAMPSQVPQYLQDDRALAHLLFTSGSTGQPKGVMISHRNVHQYIDWAVNYFGYQSGDRISGHPPLHFDLSTMDIYSTFAAGAELHLVPPQYNLLPHKIASFIRERQLTQWFSVPSLLAYMAKFDAVAQDDFPHLRRLLWCGERFPTPALAYWMKRLPHVTFTNLYGPTETTIASSFYRVPEVPATDETPIPIGKPCEGESLYVLNSELKPVPPGEIAELYIGGVGLSIGYWNDPEKTRAVFIDEPFGPGSERIYRTGDLASVGEDGLVYLHGRVDSQIKSRGYRIELGEIETALHAAEGIREAAVVGIDTDAFEGATICCAVVPEQPADFQPQVLRQKLSERLPHYMLPSRWLCFDSLPLNDNGKIDRPKLRRCFQQEQPAGTPLSTTQHTYQQSLQ